MSNTEHKIEVVETPEVPWLSVMLGYGPMLPFIVGAAAAWTVKGVWRDEAILLTIIWAAAILAFLAGARRGLSFRTEGGPASAQIATMFCLFLLALASLIGVVHSYALFAIICLLLGFVAILILDPIAARQGQVPLFFARLRPPQMAIAVVGLSSFSRMRGQRPDRVQRRLVAWQRPTKLKSVPEVWRAPSVIEAGDLDQ